MHSPRRCAVGAAPGLPTLNPTGWPIGPRSKHGVCQTNRSLKRSMYRIGQSLIRSPTGQSNTYFHLFVCLFVCSFDCSFACFLRLFCGLLCAFVRLFVRCLLARSFRSSVHLFYVFVYVSTFVRQLSFQKPGGAIAHASFEKPGAAIGHARMNLKRPGGAIDYASINTCFCPLFVRGFLMLCSIVIFCRIDFRRGKKICLPLACSPLSVAKRQRPQA